MDEITKQEVDDALEKPWILVLFTVATFAAIYAGFWILYIFQPFLKQIGM